MFKRRFKSTKKFGKNNISRTKENKGTIETYENLQGLTINQIMTKEYLPIKTGGISFYRIDDKPFDIHKACANIYFSIKDYCSLFEHYFEYKLTYDLSTDCIFLFEQLEAVLSSDESYNIDYIDDEFKVVVYKEILAPERTLFFLSYCKIEPYSKSHPVIYNWLKHLLISLSYYQGIHISEENPFIEMELNLYYDYENIVSGNDQEYGDLSENEKEDYKELIVQCSNYIESGLNDILLEIVEMRKCGIKPFTFYQLEEKLNEIPIEECPIELDYLFQHIRNGIDLLSSDSLLNYLYNDNYISSEKIYIQEYERDSFNPGTLMFNVVYDSDDMITERAISNISDTSDQESPLIFQGYQILKVKDNQKIQDSDYIMRFADWFEKLIEITDELNN